MSFVGLHVHSDYSLLDGASQLPDLVDRVKELGMSAIALTDHGVMYGAIELIKLCRTRSIKPIVGNEMYVINGDIEQKKRYQKYHQVVLAKNTQGYKNLVKLTTISHLKGSQGKGIQARPCINKELLEQHREGLIVTSGCLAGEVPQNILHGRVDSARKVAQWYKDIFGDDYYLEIQDHGSPEDRVVNVELVNIGKELGIKVIATNDSHFVSCYDVEAHDALLCIQTGKLITEDKRMRYSGTEYLKSAEEMALLFRDHLPSEVIRDAIANTLEVADKVKPYEIFNEPRLPFYQIPSDYTADTYLEKVTKDGLRERLNTRNYVEIDTLYRERLEYELKMIERMGFSTYFLVVWDYIKYAREHNIPVGPGRGSAAGSLVAYALRITNIDPVHHGLLFERFLNPERKSMPDIDTDFCIERRDDVIKYVTDKYGADNVAQIITFNSLNSKSVLKDVARVLNIPYKEADEMAKLIPVARGKAATLSVMIADDTPAPEFKEKYENNENTRHWIDMAMRIEGTHKTYGVHAAGIVISAQPLDEIVPLQLSSEGVVITQYFMEDLDSLGLLKMDFLGLRNLTIIQKTLELIKKNNKTCPTPDEINLEERKAYKTLLRGEVKKRPGDVDDTYKKLEEGDLEGIFQLESSGMRDVVQKLKPSSVEDLSSILALYRPGPLDAGLVPQFIDRKHGRAEITHQHHLLEPILKETYGILVYQEQIMQIARELAGYSLGQADLLRRAMSKKKAEEMEKQRETFIDGATKNGINRKVADSLFAQMVNFAEYCFNKSHSTAYAYVTYQTAYLKANFAGEYMAALLSANSDDQDKVKKYVESCKKINIKVEPPDINRSGVEFTPLGENNILFGLSAVRNVGQGAVECILAARDKGGEFKSLADLCDRINLHSVNSRALESLIKCGAFDSIEPNRKKLVTNLNLVIKWAQDKAKDREVGQLNLFDLPGDTTTDKSGFESAPKMADKDDYPSKEKLQYEKELLGFYVSDHPLKALQELTQIQQLNPISLSQLEEQRQGAKVVTIVILTDIKPVITKKGDRMAILQIEDIEDKAEAVVFPKTYEIVQELLVKDVPVILSGKIDRQDSRTQLIVEKIEGVEIDRLATVEVTTPPVKDDPEQLQQETTLQEHSGNKQEDIVPTASDKVMMVEFTPQLLQDLQRMEDLRTLLKEYSGDKHKTPVPVFGMVANQHRRIFVRFGEEFWVQDLNRVTNRLKNNGFTVDILQKPDC